MNPAFPSRPHAPLDGRRRRRHRVVARVVEFFLLAVSLSSLLTLALIFLFVGREALPVALGQVNAALVQEALPVATALQLPPEELQDYLGLTRQEFARLDTWAIRELAALKAEAHDRIPPAIRADPDARVNTVAWRYLLAPHRWNGYDAPAFVWQPVSLIRKYNIVPILLGSLKVSLVALVTAIPLALAASLYVAQLAPPRFRHGFKSAIELLEGLPSVVIGLLALTVLAGILEAPTRALADALAIPVSRLNACVAGVALGLALIPVIFSVAEDAMTAVPRTYTSAALALGATRWQAAWQVVVPAALPGLCAAVLLGFGRAMGETMIVLMASGNAALLSWNVLEPTRTMSATIAAEMAEAVFGGHHYRMLFLVGTVLFAITFLSNLLADLVMQRLKLRWSRSA